MSKSVFETLRELENDKLWFPEIEHGYSDLRIEATSYLKETDIDAMIREKLSDIYVLENMKCKSSQDPPPVFYYPEQIKLWREMKHLTYYIFRYDIAKIKPSDEVPDLHVGETWLIPENWGADNLALLNEAGQGDCPDCKVGYYTPFVGPREICQTCNGTKKVAVAAPATDNLKYDFGRYVSQLLRFINLGTCNVVPYSDIKPHERIDFSYSILDCNLDPKMKWGGSRLARCFYQVLRDDLLSRVVSKKEVKLHFDYSSLKVEQNTMTRSYDMSMLIHMRVVT